VIAGGINPKGADYAIHVIDPSCLANVFLGNTYPADRVLDNPPYNLVVHTSPAQDPTNEYYHWHIEFMPKLTKTAGFEWGTGFYINPTPPEEAAKFLREASVEDGAPSTVAVR